MKKPGDFGLIQNMKTSAKKLVSEALNMPKSIRTFAAERISENPLDANAELSPEWEEEVEKRCRELDEGTMKRIEAEEVFTKACARLS